jgi:uncharacterized protein
MTDAYRPTTRTRLHRRPARGVYDKARVHAILDEAFICHVGFVVDGQPFVIPTAYARIEDQVYVHGAAAGRFAGALGGGIDICLTVTLVDGLVLARSAFHHSINYRSVVALGRARVVANHDEKRRALASLTNHVVPGRWDEVRQPDEQEISATTVLALALEEVSAKVRVGAPIDAEADLTWPAWAGVVPLRMTAGTPEPDAHVQPDLVFRTDRLQRRSQA